jgi:hypothetical protein
MRQYKPVARKGEREVLNNICIEFGVPMKLAGLIKMYLNEAYGNVLTYT